MAIVARTFAAGCEASDEPAPTFQAASGPDGSYEVWIHSWSGPDVCVEVTAVHEKAGAPDSIVSLVPMSLTLPPHPTVQLDIVFPG